jgi:lysozyme
MSERLKALLMKHEGLKLKPYKCTAGKATIGVGRNLDDVGISQEEAMHLLENDIKRCVLEANKFSWFKGLDDVRQEVVISMIFNLGIYRFKGFKKLIGALMIKDYKEAALEMLDSQWSEQVGKRSFELAKMMETGIY